MIGGTRALLYLVCLTSVGVLPAAAATTTRERPDAGALAAQIDHAIGQRLAAEKVPASARADDGEFLRRVYLDITGVIPRADKAAAFLDSKDPDKRAKLIDELLASSAYGRHMADTWHSLLLPRTSDSRRLPSEPLVKWLEERFNQNEPWDRMVSELLTVTGPADENGAVTYFVSNPTPDKLTDSVSRLFLGVQLQCAQCHNHPFTQWKQTEYWGMAAFFTRVRTNANPKNAAKKGITLAIGEGGKGRAPKLPDSAKRVPPRFFQGEEPNVSSSEPLRPVLAKWLTAADNPFFARAMVNRTWAQFFGRGFVNPIDDMHKDNVPSHPELLQLLSRQFVASGYDLKFLIRAICNSQAYQRTSRPTAANEDDSALFSHMTIKVLTPEQLYDSLAVVIGTGDRPVGGRGKKGAKPAQQAKRGPVGARAQFVAFFGTEDGADPTEYQAGIPQALRLMNSPQLSNGAALLNQAARGNPPPARVIEQLYLATLSRRPTAAETARLTAYVGKHATEMRKAYGDILWALLNSSEFALNH